MGIVVSCIVEKLATKSDSFDFFSFLVIFEHSNLATPTPISMVMVIAKRDSSMRANLCFQVEQEARRS
jgi:hypothetical protein